MKHVTRKQQILAGCLVSIAVVGCSRSDAHHQTSPQPPPQVAEDRCKPWRFSSARVDCTPDQCGLNGMWFGEGLSFRELHLNGAFNDQGLRLLGVMPPHPLGAGVEPVLGIDGDELLIKDKQSGTVLLDGRRLKGTILLIESTKHLTKQQNLQFRLEIKDVLERAFWDCEPKARSAGCKVFHYEFLATTNADDGCEVEVCAPELAQSLTSTERSIQGTAVVFAGDVYDEKHKVRSISADSACSMDALAPDEVDIINFACTGTVMSKLHLMRHTAASERHTKKTTVSQRQAMLRMLTADYCGTGHSFTHNGTPIRFQAMDWGFTSSYRLDASMTLEAVWSDRGASCLGQPRLVTRGEIAAVCMLPPCTKTKPDYGLLAPPPPSSPGLSCSDASGSYVMSALAP